MCVQHPYHLKRYHCSAIRLVILSRFDWWHHSCCSQGLPQGNQFWGDQWRPLSTSTLFALCFARGADWRAPIMKGLRSFAIMMIHHSCKFKAFWMLEKTWNTCFVLFTVDGRHSAWFLLSAKRFRGSSSWIHRFACVLKQEILNIVNLQHLFCMFPDVSRCFLPVLFFDILRLATAQTISDGTVSPVIRNARGRTQRSAMRQGLAVPLRRWSWKIRF